MIVHEKRSGEEWSYPLELEMMPPFPLPGEDWEFVEDAGKRLSVRNGQTGEVRYPPPNSQWCIHLPDLEETDWKPTRNLAARHTGNWTLIRPGDDEHFAFTPENEEERATLRTYGFTITER